MTLEEGLQAFVRLTRPGSACLESIAGVRMGHEAASSIINLVWCCRDPWNLFLLWNNASIHILSQALLHIFPTLQVNLSAEEINARSPAIINSRAINPAILKSLAA